MAEIVGKIRTGSPLRVPWRRTAFRSFRTERFWDRDCFRNVLRTCRRFRQRLQYSTAGSFCPVVYGTGITTYLRLLNRFSHFRARYYPIAVGWQVAINYPTFVALRLLCQKMIDWCEWLALSLSFSRAVFVSQTMMDSSKEAETIMLPISSQIAKSFLFASGKRIPSVDVMHELTLPSWPLNIIGPSSLQKKIRSKAKQVRRFLVPVSARRDIPQENVLVPRRRAQLASVWSKATRRDRVCVFSNGDTVDAGSRLERTKETWEWVSFSSFDCPKCEPFCPSTRKRSCFPPLQTGSTSPCLYGLEVLIRYASETFFSRQLHLWGRSLVRRYWCPKYSKCGRPRLPSLGVRLLTCGSWVVVRCGKQTTECVTLLLEGCLPF